MPNVETDSQAEVPTKSFSKHWYLCSHTTPHIALQVRVSKGNIMLTITCQDCLLRLLSSPPQYVIHVIFRLEIPRGSFALVLLSLIILT
jgi:hypothetical protein